MKRLPIPNQQSQTHHMDGCLLSSWAHPIPIPEKGAKHAAESRFHPGNYRLSPLGAVPFKKIFPTKERHVYLYFQLS